VIDGGLQFRHIGTRFCNWSSELTGSVHIAFVHDIVYEQFDSIDVKISCIYLRREVERLTWTRCMEGSWLVIKMYGVPRVRLWENRLHTWPVCVKQPKARGDIRSIDSSNECLIQRPNRQVGTTGVHGHFPGIIDVVARSKASWWHGLNFDPTITSAEDLVSPYLIK
jgi:hypothetical protein